MTTPEDETLQLTTLLEQDRFEEIRLLGPEQELAESEEKKAPEPDIRQILQKATLAQKVKLALFGNSICRLLLIRESNKLISLGVLKNPRLQASEVEDFAKNANIPEAVLRAIGQDTKWTKHPAVKRGLIFNPKCPVDVSVTLAKFLNNADIKILSRSKNIPQVLVGYAKKRMEQLDRK